MYSFFILATKFHEAHGKKNYHEPTQTTRTRTLPKNANGFLVTGSWWFVRFVVKNFQLSY